MEETLPSKSNDTPSVSSRPIQRIANARRMWPCATTRTSAGVDPLWGVFRLVSWNRVRMSCTSLSRRVSIACGDLQGFWKDEGLVFFFSFHVAFRSA